MLVPAMCKKLVVAIEPLSTEAALGMASESALIDRTRIIITKLLMFLKFGKGKEIVLVSEDFFVSGAKVTVPVRICTQSCHEKTR